MRLKITEQDIENGRLDLSDEIITEKAFQQIKKFSTKICILDLRSSKLDKKCFFYMRYFENLEILHLDESNISDEDLKPLVEKNLLTFSVSFTNVTNSGLHFLSQMHNLYNLDLGYTKITDKGLLNLKKLTKLKSLDVSGPNITCEGVKELQSYIPECRIVHSGNSLTSLKNRIISRKESAPTQSLYLLEKNVRRYKGEYDSIYLGYVENGINYNRVREAEQNLLTAERQLAAALGEEYAMNLDDFPVTCCDEDPTPLLFTNSKKTLLIFNVKKDDEFWLKTHITVEGNQKKSKKAVVKFENCLISKLGALNDEIQATHPLEGKGADSSMFVQVVKNSSWLESMEKMNSSHRYYNPFQWKFYIHYIFWFTDYLFECIATDYKANMYFADDKALLEKII